MRILTSATVLSLLLSLAVSTPLLAQEPTPPNQTEKTAVVDDSQITAAVKANLAAITELKSSTVEVTTSSGIVKLTGSLDSQAQHDKAVSAATGVSGVTGVDTSGLIVTPQN